MADAIPSPIYKNNRVIFVMFHPEKGVKETDAKVSMPTIEI